MGASTDLIPVYCDVLTHVHSVFPHNPTCAGRQTVAEVMAMAAAFGAGGVAFTEHTSDPAAPAQAAAKWLLSAFSEQSRLVHETVVQQPDSHSLRCWSGAEVNILPGGHPDVDEGELHDLASYVVASQHGGLGVTEKDPAAIVERLAHVCSFDGVDTLGHPSRYNDECDVDWVTVFARAAATNTAVEVNFNLWFTKGPGRGRFRVGNDIWYDGQLAFWRNWLLALANSGAPVVVGLDIHNTGMWPLAGPTWKHFCYCWQKPAFHPTELLVARLSYSASG